MNGGIPSSLGVAVSSLGSRLSLGLSVLSEGGGVDSEWGGVSSEGGGVSGEPSCIPLAVRAWTGSSVGVGGGVLVLQGAGVEAGAGLRVRASWTGSVGVGGIARMESTLLGVELCSSPSPREREESLGTNEGVFSTRRHCMMLVSLPPVEMRWLSLCRKLTLVTWLLWALYLWLGAWVWGLERREKVTVKLIDPLTLST